MDMHITAHAAKPQVERNLTFTPLTSTILNSKRWYKYGGEHGTFNAVFLD
jgi:hypothetical protein